MQKPGYNLKDTGIWVKSASSDNLVVQLCLQAVTMSALKTQ